MMVFSTRRPKTAAAVFLYQKKGGEEIDGNTDEKQEGWQNGWAGKLEQETEK
jgi:hypothetical protein